MAQFQSWLFQRWNAISVLLPAAGVFRAPEAGARSLKKSY
jgi:hypothetical protein